MISNRILKQVLILNTEKNFARAAEKLFVSQPTLTRNIQSLERKLGYKIFDRAPRNLQLTPFGEMLVRHAEKIVSGTSLLENEIAQFSNLQSGHLRFGLGPYPAEGVAGEAIGIFNDEFPKIHMQVIIDSWVNLYSLLINEKIEFFIAEISEFTHKENINITPYRQHKGFLYCKPDHPILKKGSVTLRECKEYTWIQPTIAKRAHGTFHDDLNTPVGKDTRALVQCDNISLAKQIVLNSLALGLGNYSVTKDLLDVERIRIVPLEQDLISTNYGVVKINNHTLSPAAQRIIHNFNDIEHRHCQDEDDFFAGYLSYGSLN